MKRFGVVAVLVLSLAGAWPAAARADCGADCSASCDGLPAKDCAKCMEPCLKRCLKDDPPPVPAPSPPKPTGWARRPARRTDGWPRSSPGPPRR